MFVIDQTEFSSTLKITWSKLFLLPSLTRYVILVLYNYFKWFNFLWWYFTFYIIQLLWFLFVIYLNHLYLMYFYITTINNCYVLSFHNNNARHLSTSPLSSFLTCSFPPPQHRGQTEIGIEGSQKIDTRQN